jgi:hypothetical protein
LHGGQPDSESDAVKLPIIRDVPKDAAEFAEKTDLSSDKNTKPKNKSTRAPYNRQVIGSHNKPADIVPKNWNPIAQPVPNLTIGTQDPFGKNSQLSRIVENTLPRGLYGRIFNFKTLTSRWTLYDFVKQTFNAPDGDNMGFGADGNCSNLLSYIKLVHLNPAYYSLTNLNPWEGLPHGLIINQGCYPPVLIQKNQTTGCAQNTIDLNIRIYALNRAEYCAYHYKTRLTMEYDVWRELEYYKYVKNFILRNRTPQSPNFPMIYAYYFANNQALDYLAIKRKCLTQTQLMAKEYVNFELRFTIDAKQLGQIDLTPTGSAHPDLTRPLTLDPPTGNVSSTGILSDIAQAQTISPAPTFIFLPEERDPWLNMYSGQMLTIVTEAYHYNFYQWASRQYETRGIVEKMTATGFYDKSVWLSIYFQIIQALYTLQVNGIYIKDMTLEDNVYIKDLQIVDKSRGYWEYVVDGVTYYVPNFGYMVMIDTNYKDIKVDLTMDSVDCNGHAKRKYKIYTSDIFGKRYKLDQIQHFVYENYKSIVNINCFTDTYTRNMVNRPPSEIMELLQQMSADPEENLGEVLKKYFPMFMNNRIGSYVKPNVEIANLQPIGIGSIAVGDVVAEVITDNVYKWAIVSKILPDNKVEIISRTEPRSATFVTKDILVSSLEKYTDAVRLEQNPCFGLYYTFEELIETYYLNSQVKLTTC